MVDYKKINKAVFEFVNGVGIVKKSHIITFITKFGLSEPNAERLLNRLKKNNIVYLKDDFVVSSNNKSITDYFEENNLLEKINSLYLHLYGKVDYITRDCKFPCKAVLINRESGFAINVFRLTDDYANECNIIESCFATKMTEITPLNSVLILDGDFNKNDVFLTPNFNVLMTCQNGKFTAERS